jgi:hypothetical protein
MRRWDFIMREGVVMGAEARASGATAKLLLLVFAVLLVLSRWVAINLDGAASDVPWYARYAREQGDASRRGMPFYDYHADAVQKEIDAARAAGKPTPAEEYKVVEYPPLAVALMRLPELWMRGPQSGGDPRREFARAYASAYRGGLAVVDAALGILVVGLVWRLFGSESPAQRMGRILIYVLATFALLPFLYDRLDLLQAALVVAAFALLIARRLPGHWVWSFAVLALAVHLKVAPVVLAPVWVVGSLPATAARSADPAKLLATLAWRTAVFVVLVGAGVAFFATTAGRRALEFLSYHRSRGVEVESLPASLLLLLRPLGHDVDVYFSHCSLNVRSALSPTLAAGSVWALAGLCLAATAGLWMHCRRLTQRPGSVAAAPVDQDAAAG